MTFDEILDQAIALLQRRGRLTYRALKRQFDLDDAYLEDLKEELITGQRVAADENGAVLVWIGGTESVDTRALEPAGTQKQSPLSYTPKHLAEKILTTRSALEGERKQVTVFFCDLANSTPLAERLGPETMHRLLNQFFALSLDTVHHYEGTINQFLGDGFMALFGAPIAHEDHARRAVLAAVSLRQRLHEGSDTLSQQYGVEVDVRIGLHTGMVIVGAIGDNLRMDYTAVGDTTNVASRLQNAAVPGQIIISEATHRLVAGYCTTQSLGELSLKGKTGSTGAWEVLSTREARTRLEVETERGLTPFVGRARELQLLADSFAQTQSGHGQVVFIVGEPAIGKSRLLLEFHHRLGMQATWLESHTMSFGRSMAFYPLIDLLKRNFHIEEDDSENTIIDKITQSILRLGADLSPILPYLRYLLAVDPDDVSVQTMDPQLRRVEIFDALQRLLLRAAEVRPLVVVFEDLHWMDQATEDFLRFLTDRIPASRVLCLLTYRPDYVHPFGERTYYTRIVLQTLSNADSIEMAEAMLATEHLPEALQSLIVQKAEGNPFFVEEVVKSLQEVGAIQQVKGRYILARRLDDIEVPDTLQDIIMSRIDRLEEAPKKTLQLAAVIGREFTHRLLDRLADIRERTETCLQQLKAIELIYEKRLFPELAYMFKHALTQDVAYNSLLDQRRKELHRLIGHAIEELYADRLAEQYAVLAYHLAKGEEWTKALDYLCKAAQQATQAFATREAVALYTQALDTADHLGPAVELKTLIAIHQALANLYFVLSDYERSRSAGERALALARQAGDRESEGAALAGIGWASTFAHDFDQALTYARQAIAVAEAIDAKTVLTRSHFTMGYVDVIRSARLDHGRREIDQALTLSRSVGDVIGQSVSLTLSGFIKNWEGEYDEALRLASEGMTIAREHHLLVPLLHGCFRYGIILTGKGAYDEALTTFQEGLVLAEKAGDAFSHLRLLNCCGWLYLELGALDRAFALNGRSAEGARERSDPEITANAELNLADIALAKSDLPLAHEFLEGVNRLVNDPATSDWMKWRYSTHLFASLGELWLVRSDPNKAQAFADQCLDIARRTNSRKNMVKGQRLKGEIALARRQWDEAEAWLRQALTLAQTIGNPAQLWKAHLALGRFHAAARQPEQSWQAYRAARAVIERVKANLRNSELRAGIENSSLIQHVYDLSASDYTSIG